MKAVHVIQGRAVPLERSDVDTDQIIPSDWLKRVERTGFGRGLFSQWRDGKSFVLNQPEFVGASILIAGPRFGTGSSREHAVWALMDYGFEAIIASSYGDIFKNNSSKQGLVIVELPQEAVSELMELVKADPNLEITVDVADMTVEIAEKNWRQPFTLDPITRERLLNGWDDIGISLLRETDISTFEATHRAGSLRGVFDGEGRVVHSNE